ncbi:FGLLP motif-containing membrane protein [Streptomyces sp. SID3343]|uniref:FGLLP motif-containing membrane protein n=1 Tax=Streptomyces sp. SID3343 TaxID=2690260 RepID=UPI00136829BB|nr:FGLLP motif-containing membrane protein [Streptomyces sp. SID3343]MYW05038.1 hypothetical protein [Streptomyces sp. SID3343]
MRGKQVRVRAAFAAAVGTVAALCVPLFAHVAVAAPAGPSVSVTPGTALPGDIVTIKGSGLAGCAMNTVDVYLESNNGGSSGGYADLLASDLPVDTAHANTIAFRHPVPTPVYNTESGTSLDKPVNQIVVRCARTEKELASTPITINRSRTYDPTPPPAELAAKGLLLTPSTGAPGTPVTLWTDIRCGDANADDDAQVTWAGRELTKLSIQGNDGEAYSFTVPAGPARGPQQIAVRCFAQGVGMPDNGVTQQADFTVPAPALTVTPKEAVAGQPLRVEGSGFVACGQPADGGRGELTVRLGATVLGNVPVAADGRFAGDVPVPREVPGGAGTLTLACATGGYDGDFSVDLAVRAATTPAAAEPSDPDRSRSAAALPSPGDLFDEPRPLVLAGATAVLALPVLGFSAELFNKTWAENRLRIRRRLRPGAARPRSQPRVPELQVLLFVVLSAAFCVAVEPGTGWNTRTGALALALLVAVPLGVLVYEGPAEAYRRRVSRIRALPRLVPGALGVALVLATASRLLELTPGYVYGLFLAFTTAGLRRMAPADEGRAVALGAWSLAGLAVAAWVWRIPVTHILNTSDGSPFGWVVTENLLTQTYVAAVVGLVFGLLPMQFLDGHALWQWNRLAWAAIYAVALFLFTLTLIDPTGPASGQTQTMWLRSTTLFATAATTSTLFWSIFRLRPPQRTT